MTVAVVVVVAAAVAAAAAPRMAPGRSARLTTVAALSPVIAVLAVLLAIIAVAVAGWLGLVVAVPAVVLVAWQLPPRRHREAGATDGAEIRVASINAWLGRASHAAIATEMAAFRPDVLVVQELTAELATPLARSLTDLLPYARLHPSGGSAGIGVWSRFPLAELAPVPATKTLMPRVLLQADWPVTVTPVHTAAPVTSRHSEWQHDFGQLLAAVTATSGHQLIVGDFNASRDHRPFRKLLSAGLADCADAALSRQWPGFTWPANRRYPAIIRLDHILVSQPGAVVRQTRRIRVPGSDHLGVLAIIDLLPLPGATAARLTDRMRADQEAT